MKLYFTGNTQQIIVMNGKWVGVCWNTANERKVIKGDDGLEYSAQFYRAIDRAYIIFPIIREYNDGVVYRDDDSSVMGGVEPRWVPDIIEELRWALEYCEKQGDVLPEYHPGVGIIHN